MHYNLANHELAVNVDTSSLPVHLLEACCSRYVNQRMDFLITMELNILNELSEQYKC